MQLVLMASGEAIRTSDNDDEGIIMQLLTLFKTPLACYAAHASTHKTPGLLSFLHFDDALISATATAMLKPLLPAAMHGINKLLA